MPETVKFLVKIQEQEAFLTIVGKAGYLNCRSVADFFATVAEKKCSHLFIDTSQCSGMDSTFLGMIAGVALRLRKYNAEVILLNLSERNRQVVENLGLYKLVKISKSEEVSSEKTDELSTENASNSLILDAHENLVKADKTNLEKFEDVLSFLRKENGQK